MDNIFVVAAWIVGKGIGKVASFVGKIFVVRPPTTNILPHENYQLYGREMLASLETMSSLISGQC